MAAEWMTFELTDRCQLSCAHCLRDPGKKPKDLSVQILGKALTEARQVFRSEHAVFTGGEPTQHPQFAAVVDATVDLGYTWHMVSNGQSFRKLMRLFDERPVRREKLTSVTLSLDGADEETHDGIRGAGAYREVMTAASLCTSAGIPFIFNTAVHAKNAHQIEAMALLAAQLRASRQSYVMLCATGSVVDADLYLSASAWRRIADRIDRIAEAMKIPIGVPEGYYCEQPWHVCQPMAGQQVHVDVEGRVTLCCQHAGVPRRLGDDRDIAGSLHELSLSECIRRYLNITTRFMQDKISAMERGELDTAWDRFPCNYCMRYFGKPYWTDDGVGGPPAVRIRRQKQLFPIVA